MIDAIYLWYLRWFCVISKKQAKELKLEFYCNIYGDRINYFNCRSLWQDSEGRLYKVAELYNDL